MSNIESPMPGEDDMIKARQLVDEGLRLMFNVMGRVPIEVITVKPGNTLWHIAEARWGNGQRWREIFLMNLAVLWRGAEAHSTDPGPDTIFPGTELYILSI